MEGKRLVDHRLLGVVLHFERGRLMLFEVISCCWLKVYFLYFFCFGTGYQSILDMTESGGGWRRECHIDLG